MDLGLEGRVAPVTGGSRGIGRAICLALAAEGARVGVNHLQSRREAEVVAKEISEKHGGRAVLLCGDLGREEDAVAMLVLLEQEFSRFDILINNAASCPTIVGGEALVRGRELIVVNMEMYWDCDLLKNRKIDRPFKPFVIQLPTVR